MDTYVTVLIRHGLGNQLFQIAGAYVVAKDLGVDFKISYKNCLTPENRESKRYVTSVFSNIDFQDTTLYSTDKITNDLNKTWIYIDLASIVTRYIRNFGYACIYAGLQTELYFAHRKQEIQTLFTPHGGYTTWLRLYKPELAAKYSELFEDHGYCFIGVRRGDYISTKKNIDMHNPCGRTYYFKALDIMPSQRYYISSDDIEWCKKTFIGPEFRFFELGTLDDEAQFALMTLFRRYIISNSTYYWWGSYLSHYDDYRVIAPDKWIGGSDAKFQKYYSIYRDDMTIIERPVEV
jgi:hypothetical protein